MLMGGTPLNDTVIVDDPVAWTPGVFFTPITTSVVGVTVQ
jgi:hypothetical protein